MTFEKKQEKQFIRGKIFYTKTITGFKKVTWKLTAKRFNGALNAV